MRTLPILIGAALLGLVLGPALDQIHVQTDTLSYAHPWWLEQAWWVGPQFAVAFAAIAGGALLTLQRFARTGRPSSGEVAWSGVAFVVAYLVTGVGHEYEWIVVAVLGVALVLRIGSNLSDLDSAILVTILMLAIGGSAYEATLSSSPETFEYAVASLGTIPVWLPLLYAHAAFAVVVALRALSWRETQTSAGSTDR